MNEENGADNPHVEPQRPQRPSPTISKTAVPMAPIFLLSPGHDRTSSPWLSSTIAILTISSLPIQWS